MVSSSSSFPAVLFSSFFFPSPCNLLLHHCRCCYFNLFFTIWMYNLRFILFHFSNFSIENCMFLISKRFFPFVFTFDEVSWWNKLPRAISDSPFYFNVILAILAFDLILFFFVRFYFSFIHFNFFCLFFISKICAFSCDPFLFTAPSRTGWLPACLKTNAVKWLVRQKYGAQE